MALNTVFSGTLGEANVGFTAAAAFLNPLGAQIDALVGFALGPFSVDLSARLNASLALQATLSISVGSPLIALQAAISAVAALQAALQAALALPPITISVSTQLSVAAGLAGTLSAQLGLLTILIEAALAIKIPAIKAAAAFAANISAGPLFIQTFDGTLSGVGGEIASDFGSGLVSPNNTAHNIASGDTVFGVILTTKTPVVETAMKAIFKTV